MEEELPIELEPPDGVEEAETAVEVLRAWIGDGALLVSLNSSAFGDHVEDWGRLWPRSVITSPNRQRSTATCRRTRRRLHLREAFTTSFETAAAPRVRQAQGPDRALASTRMA